MIRSVLYILVLTILWGSTAAAFGPGRAPFSLHAGRAEVPYSVYSLCVLPQSSFEVTASGGRSGSAIVLEPGEADVVRSSQNRWSLRAPETPGNILLVFRDPATGDSIRLNVFVVHPIERVKDERLAGYRIGTYPPTALKGLDVYLPPRGFIEVTEENSDLQISPHFQLRQFLCKQSGGFPKFVVLSPRLLHKLEMILERVNESGIATDTFHIMSGYRTPFYNRAIGNVRYSRHIYGDAADIFIDVDKDGHMDDLDGNGRSNEADGEVLERIIESMSKKSFVDEYLGGLASYRENEAHGPFVHVDARGFRARW